MTLSKTLENVKKKSYFIEIFGLGYVGFPIAVRLASSGLKIRGIDVNENRVKRLNENHLMDSEIYLKDQFLKCKKQKNLEILSNPIKTDMCKVGIICVPTPIPNKNTDSATFVISAVEKFLESSKEDDVIILESSIEVGTTDRIQEIIEKRGFKVGNNFGLCFCPERIDPANKEWGIENIPRVIYCSDNNTFDIAKQIYQHVNNANLIRVESPKVAEIVKSFENAFRLVNISLVNELAVLCDKLGVNVNSVIKAASTKPFGFLAHYPGAGAGGHCIPKDPRFLLESAKKNDFKFTIIENALNTNLQMPTYIVNSIEKSLELMKFEKSVIVCGLAYKANVEDMRDSPSFKIINEFKKRNFKVFGYDPFFNMHLLDKYLIENNLSEANFEVLKELDDKKLKDVSCLCIVQHHEQMKKRLKEIYDGSLVPFIYDCQSKLTTNTASKTVLDFLGN
jgi:UDP-N-acetyl-D-glucosamine dehydrogenase